MVGTISLETVGFRHGGHKVCHLDPSMHAWRVQLGHIRSTTLLCNGSVRHVAPSGSSWTIELERHFCAMGGFGGHSEDVSIRWSNHLAVISLVMRSKASWNMFVPLHNTSFGVHFLADVNVALLSCSGMVYTHFVPISFDHPGKTYLLL